MKDDKVGILDLKAKLNNEIICNIEMQVIQQKDIDKRIMFYWSKMYTGEIKERDKYSVLKRTVVILIAKFELRKLKNIPKFHTKWQVREEEYRKIILTDTLGIHIIELPKLIKQLRKNKGNKKNDESFILNLENEGDENMSETNYDEKLMLWLMFMLDPDSISEEELKDNEDIRLAKEELEKIKQDEHERYMAELRIKHIRDSQAIEDYAFEEGLERGLEDGLKQGLEQGIQQGIEQGMQQGIEQGMQQGLEQARVENKNKQLEIAKKLLDLKMPIEQIIEITGLTEEEIKQLNK